LDDNDEAHQKHDLHNKKSICLKNFFSYRNSIICLGFNGTYKVHWC